MHNYLFYNVFRGIEKTEKLNQHHAHIGVKKFLEITWLQDLNNLREIKLNKGSDNCKNDWNAF